MSSHHFVKEDQEPALLICDPVLDPDYLFQLLEWSPKVIVLQHVIDFTLLLGIKIDVVICEAQFRDALEERLYHQRPVRFLTMEGPAVNLLMCGITYLSEVRYPAVHVVARADRDMLSLLPQTSLLNIVIWNDNIKWSYCANGAFKKWVAKAHTFLFFHDDNLEIETDTDILIKREENYATGTIMEEGLVKISMNNNVAFWLGEYIY